MKTNTVTKIILFTFITFIFYSCEKTKNGACEYAYYQSGGNWGTPAAYHYYCSWESDEDGCQMKATTSHYHENQSCKDLGYTDKLGENYFASEHGEDYSGENGYFASIGKGLYDDGDGGSTSTKPAYCTSTYEGPNSEPQRDSFCQSVWNYMCNAGYSPTSSEITSLCNTFNEMAQFGTPVVTCPYCK